MNAPADFSAGTCKTIRLRNEDILSRTSDERRKMSMRFVVPEWQIRRLARGQRSEHLFGRFPMIDYLNEVDIGPAAGPLSLRLLVRQSSIIKTCDNAPFPGLPRWLNGQGGGAGRTGCMNHGARDGSRVRIPKRSRFFFFSFFLFLFFSVPNRQYTITRDCGLTARSMVVPGGAKPPSATYAHWGG